MPGEQLEIVEARLFFPFAQSRREGRSSPSMCPPICSQRSSRRMVVQSREPPRDRR